jgi:hypothetical protein
MMDIGIMCRDVVGTEAEKIISDK